MMNDESVNQEFNEDQVIRYYFTHSPDMIGSFYLQAIGKLGGCPVE